MIYGPHRKWAAASGILWALIDCLDKTTACCQWMLECLSRTEENSRDGFSILKALRRRFFFNDFNGGRKEAAGKGEKVEVITSWEMGNRLLLNRKTCILRGLLTKSCL
jgi:hypothetical protein